MTESPDKAPAAKPPAVNPLVKTVLEIGPILAFLATYVWLKDDTFAVAGREYTAFIAVTAMFVPVFLVANGILWALTGHVSRMQVFTMVLLVIMGGLAVWFNDPRFVKLKPTVTYVVLGGLLGIGLAFGQSFLRYLMEELTPLQDEGWMLLTRRLMLFFFAMAAANEVIWRFMSDDVFVFWDTLGQFGATMAFFIAQAGLFTRYSLDEGDDNPAG
jgi:intracellular septation protein